jgi:hypothetical protein
MKLLDFFILNLLLFSASSTVVEEEIHYNGFDLLKIYYKFLSKPDLGNNYNFETYAFSYYEDCTEECLKLMERYQNDWMFIRVYWKVLSVKQFMEPVLFFEGDHLLSLKWLIEGINWIFFRLCSNEELKFRAQVKIISVLINVAEKISSNLKSQIGSKDTIKLDDKISIHKFLIKNISFNFNRGIINCESLFRTFGHIRNIICRNSPVSDSLHIHKMYALLWYYLFDIWMTESMEMFEYHNQDRPLVIYLILELWEDFPIYEPYEESYPNNLKIRFEELYKGGSLNFSPIKKVREKCNPRKYLPILKAPKRISNFNEVTHFFEYNYFVKDKPHKKLRIQMLAEIEHYISSKGPRK